MSQKCNQNGSGLSSATDSEAAARAALAYAAEDLGMSVTHYMTVLDPSGKRSVGELMKMAYPEPQVEMR